MKALVYKGPRKVRIEDVPDPQIERPTNVLVRITTTNICGRTFTCTRVVQTWPREPG
jgi:threonine dehydrogenase-like Zn-dependent dehydrogenase